MDVLASPTFRGKNQRLASRAVAILREEKPMTLRQLYYRLISSGVIGNAQAEYNRLGKVMVKLRESGVVPRTWMVDHLRTTLKPSSWSGLADFGESVRACYRKDFWASLPHHVEVFVEKDAIAGAIQPVTEEYDIGLRVCRGYSSVSFAGEIADLWGRIEKPIFAYYLGDFDPSGFDLERDLREKLQRYTGRVSSVWSADQARAIVGEKLADFHGDAFYWVRLAVRSADFDLHDLIRLPVKTTDRRARGFLEEHGEGCAEVDALPPTELRRRVQEAIQVHIDPERWDRLLEVERAETATLERLVESLQRPNGESEASFRLDDSS